MSKTDVAVLDAKLPAHLQGASNAISEFTEGVTAGFPIISIRGRVWRVKAGGVEQVHTDENDDAVSSVELVLIQSSPALSKIFYDKKYEEGDDGRPRCYSVDSVKPADDVQDPIHSSCKSCPKNQWGSRITDSGKKSRACADVRRVVVAFAHEVEKAAEDPNHELTVLLLRIPAASLNPLKEYVKTKLEPKGIQPYMLVTRLGFDNDADYPKLTFKPARFLEEPEYDAVVAVRDSDVANRILQSGAEYGTEGTTEDGDEVSEGAATSSATETASAPSGSKKKKGKKKKKKAKRDATAAEAEAAAAATVESVTPDDEEEETEEEESEQVEDPTPTTDDESEEEESEEESEEEEGGDDFDKMLDSILGDD